MVDLTPDVRAFLEHGTRTGHLGFLASDGRPLGAPVWFVLEGDRLAFTTEASSAKARAFGRDPRVVMVVDQQEPPYAFVQLQGTVEVSEDPDLLHRVARACGGRYMGAERAEEFGARNAVPGEWVVLLTPDRVVANLDVTA